jgi:hypothetical protein
MKLNVFSLIDSEKPVKLEIFIGFDIETLFSYGDNLFIGSRNGMFIYSISNPENQQNCQAYSTLPLVIQSLPITHPM